MHDINELTDSKYEMPIQKIVTIILLKHEWINHIRSTDAGYRRKENFIMLLWINKLLGK